MLSFYYVSYPLMGFLLIQKFYVLPPLRLGEGDKGGEVFILAFNFCLHP